jgi:hypothetical protein
MIAAVLASVAALAVAVVISLATHAPSSHNGCIYATIPAATGAQEIYECGAKARATCKSAATPGAFTRAAGRSIVAECRKAGVPVGGG